MPLKMLYISDNEIYEIPISKIKDGKIVKRELSGKVVLEMEILYVTENRKPYEFNRILFNRITFDDNGVYDIRAAMLSPEEQTRFAYMNLGITEVTQDITGIEDNPLPIPKAPTTPTEQEIINIKDYLNRKYPMLLHNSPDAIEYAIFRDKEVHKEQIKKMKQTYRRWNAT